MNCASFHSACCVVLVSGGRPYFSNSCNGAVQFIMSLDERSLTLRHGENYSELVAAATLEAATREDPDA